ncbi:MAG TPA: cation:proton antiporter, partial [Candidatus Acidoferrum sp.]|nr:cation:proton antiporter [Candidatus Acidoferrum sp.]
ALLPLLAPADTIVTAAGKLPWWQVAALFVAFVVAAHWLLVPFLRLIAWSGVQEAFTASALLLVLGSALAMQSLGLSMGLGAFVAGVLVADSEYRHQLEADLEPFKSLLLGLFFLAVGMSTNVGVLLHKPLVVIGGVIALQVIKLPLLLALGRWFELATSRALRFAAYLGQGGEFAFVLFTLAASMDLLSGEQKDVLILIVTISMALTPLVLKLTSIVLPPMALDESELTSLLPTGEAQDILIAGFGRFGQILGRVLNARGINYTAIDRNPEQVELVRRFGNMIYFGDVSKHALLEKAQAGSAKVLALCIDDVEHSITVVRLVKKHYPHLRIFARARNRFHEIRLRELGVDFVIRETLYSALMFTRGVLGGLGVEAGEIDRSVAAFQRQDQKLLEQQAAIGDDQASMIQSSQQAADELRRLLQQDEHD